MEGKTHYEKIIGGTEEQRQRALRILQEIFEERNEELSKYEIEKSPEDIEILKKVESIVDKMVLRYGGDPKPLPLDHIYVLKPGSILEMSEGIISGGVHKPVAQKIGAEKGESKFLFASAVAHELFHLKSFKSARIRPNGNPALYRSGLSMIDTKDASEKVGEEKEYFAMLEEAIVAECTRKFLEEIGKDAEFSAEMQAINKLKAWISAYGRSGGLWEEQVKEFENHIKYIPDPEERVKRVLAYHTDEENRQAYAAGMFNALYTDEKIETLERFTERKKLYELIDKIISSSQGKFKERDEVFEEFAKANFSGNYLPLARTIESILGEGSFRKLAEEFSEEPKK